jgi:hypothetical protein
MSHQALSSLQWVELGVELGYCSEPVCATHDGVPGTPEEDERWEAGGDPCQAIVRLWDRR